MCAFAFHTPWTLLFTCGNYGSHTHLRCPFPSSGFAVPPSRCRAGFRRHRPRGGEDPIEPSEQSDHDLRRAFSVGDLDGFDEVDTEARGDAGDHGPIRPDGTAPEQLTASVRCDERSSGRGRIGIHPQTIDLREPTREVAQAFEPRARSAGIELHMRLSRERPVLRTDPARVQQILSLRGLSAAT